MLTAHTTTGGSAAGRAKILLRAGLDNHGWDTHTRPDNHTIEIRSGGETNKVYPRPIPGHGTWWWHLNGQPIAALGDTDHAAERINQALRPTRSSR